MPVTHLHSSIASSTKPFVNGIHHFTTRYVSTPLALFVAWLSVHTSIAYFVLFGGAYLDALIGPSLFIPGEVIFIGGSLLGGRGVLNIFLVVLFIYIGAILGDSSSYWIGRGIGISLFHENNKILTRDRYHQLKDFVDRYGTKAIFFARLVGPFSKIAPVTAGILEVPFTTFLTYNIPGVFVGVGAFLAAGYFFGDHYDKVVGDFDEYLVVFFAFCVITAVGIWLYTRYKPSKKP